MNFIKQFICKVNLVATKFIKHRGVHQWSIYKFENNKHQAITKYEKYTIWKHFFFNPYRTLLWTLMKIQFLLVLELLWLSTINDYIFFLTQNKNHNGQHHFLPRLSNWCDMPILHQASCWHLCWHVYRIHKNKCMKILVTTWAAPVLIGDWKFLATIFLVCHCGLVIYIREYLKAKKELWKFQYFTIQKYNLQKKSFKRNQIPSRYHNSITNPKFQKPKYQFSKVLV
jgi:hypothetical protein